MSSEGPWPRYPPCVKNSCTTPDCCSHGHKFTWPELVGKSIGEAKVTIEKDNPEVTVVLFPSGRGRLFDFCCNRVYVFYDTNGIVVKPPIVG